MTHIAHERKEHRHREKVLEGEKCNLLVRKIEMVRRNTGRVIERGRKRERCGRERGREN